MNRVRFAPSPTGDLHLGSVRTLLYNALFAQKTGGTFIVRLEDTDQERYVPEALDRLQEAFDWLGIAPDEGWGASTEGKFGPYVQSERRAIYQEYVQKLLDEGKAYYCFATKEELEQMRQEATAAKKPPRYDGRYRDFDPVEAAKRVAAGEPHVVRLKMPESGSVTAHDVVYGDVTFEYGEYDDHVILKSDGLPTYHLASVVDDHLMEITHVLRGEEWMPSWPRHLATYAAFGWEPPTFIHLPVILGADKAKLSKRHGAKTLLQYRDEGYLPEAIINFVVFLGWNPKTTQELFLWDELVAAFDLAGINKSNPVFDEVRLDYVNGKYLRELSLPNLRERLDEQFKARGIDTADTKKLEAAIFTVQERAKRLADIPEFVSFYYQLPDYDAELLLWKTQSKAECARLLTFVQGGFEELADYDVASVQVMLASRIEHADVGNGDILWPVRVALSGSKASPSPFEIAAVLGKDETIRRLQTAIAKLT